jgi:hypothetical protein
VVVKNVFPREISLTGGQSSVATDHESHKAASDIKSCTCTQHPVQVHSVPSGTSPRSSNLQKGPPHAVVCSTPG